MTIAAPNRPFAESGDNSVGNPVVSGRNRWKSLAVGSPLERTETPERRGVRTIITAVYFRDTRSSEHVIKRSHRPSQRNVSRATSETRQTAADGTPAIEGDREKPPSRYQRPRNQSAPIDPHNPTPTTKSAPNEPERIRQQLASQSGLAGNSK